uniref:Major facilitator superfamily (MFS) profile domain-containing protein n=2 Tax=Ditylum brightwellii TaxID=49249 RepID=A0A6U3QQQ3_9STRA|mmetsp:Transcript_22694/g.33794  ORF Transcript_22694/g.33794 Transcript_22694/m.33794 type:complete len:492 (+) Transcript_22694:144-1619(+)
MDLEEDIIGVISCPGPLKYCFDRFRLRTDDATGWVYNNFGANIGIVSNIFFSTAIIFFARSQLGCAEPGDVCGRVHGLRPSSLVTVVVTFSGVITAFFMPYIGAIVDYTPKRKPLGILACILFIIIQSTQISISEQTWFAMAVLQAFNGFFYQINELCLTAYLPEIRDQVKEEKVFTWYNSIYTITGTITQVLYLGVVIVFAGIYSWNDGQIGRFGQATAAVSGSFFWYIGWHFFRGKDARRSLGAGKFLAVAGFEQIINTTKAIFKFYPRSIGTFFLGTVFVDGAVESLLSISITFYTVVLGFKATGVAILLLLVLIFSTFGAFLMYFLTRRMDPMKLYKIIIVLMMIMNFASFMGLTRPSQKNMAYLIASIFGIFAGFYYPLSRIIYAMIVPRGQEAELSGFFRYCTQVLSWLPPLTFTVINEKGYDFAFGAISVNGFMFIGLVIFMFMKPWNQCLEDAKVNKMVRENIIEDKVDDEAGVSDESFHNNE